MPRASDRAAEPLPDSFSPLDIAIDLDRADPAPDSAARTLLLKQAELIDAQIALTRHDRRHRGWQIAGERAGFAVKALIAAAAAAAATILGVMVTSAASSRTVVVDAFDAPPALAERGLSGTVVAGGVLDALTVIQTALRSTAAKRQISSAWTGDIAVQVPSTGLSIGEIDRLLHQLLSDDTHVGGDLVQGADGALFLTVRGQGVVPRTFTGQAETLPALTVQAAEYVYGTAEPHLFATYLVQADRNQDAVAFIERLFPTASAAIRPGLANSWANALSALGRGPEATAKYRLAVRLDPHYWTAWGNLIGDLWTSEGEQSAHQAGVRMQAAARDAPRGTPPPDALDWQNFHPLVQDWSSLHAAHVADARQSMGGSLVAVAGPAIADDLTRLHDAAGAELALVSSDPDDPLTRAQKLLTPAMFALMDESRAARALAGLRAFDALRTADPDVAFTYSDGPCFLGLALALTGRRAEAEAVFARMGRWVTCYSFHADGLEAAGDRPGANAAYARAVALAPSMPFAYQRWGLALQRRGDAAGASRRFAEARQRGPRWADPLKSQGDLLAARGRWREAAVMYDRALQFAPNWPQLIAARRQAQARS